LENSSPNDFFDFSFQFLPHKVFEEARFIEACKNLRDKFHPNMKDNFFSLEDYRKDRVPIDGLALFIDKTWEKIRL
jgi:hypothetical protein